jgi:drug/metabolite transporter (DMT)-like permease
MIFSSFNSSRLKGYIFIAAFLLINTANQIMFKIVAIGPGGSDYLLLMADPFFYLCGILFVGQTAAWLAVLRCLPLSKAYPFTSLMIITLLVSGRIFFEEPITLGHVVGAIVIMAGVTVIASGGNEIKAVKRGRM